MADLYLESQHQPITTGHLYVADPGLLALENEDTEGYDTDNQTGSSDKSEREYSDVNQPKQRRKRIGGSQQPKATGKTRGGSRASAKTRSSAPTRSNQ